MSKALPKSNNSKSVTFFIVNGNVNDNERKGESGMKVGRQRSRERERNRERGGGKLLLHRAPSSSTPVVDL